MRVEIGVQQVAADTQARVHCMRVQLAKQTEKMIGVGHANTNV